LAYSQWLRCYAARNVTPWFPTAGRTNRPAARLFCFPYAGGGASIFRRWRTGLPPIIEVCPVQLPGREHRIHEPPFTGLAPLVEAIAAAIPPWLDLPYAVYGHSNGALIGFELIRELRRQGAPSPFHLFVSGARAPHLRNPDPPLYDLDDDRFITALRRLNGTPDALLQDPEMLRLMLPLLRADLKVGETYSYTPEAPLECPISAFGGREDAEVAAADIDAWRTETIAQFAASMLPGDHFFLRTSETLLLRELSARLLEREFSQKADQIR
jgi:surfactin synthase thioesterase subunit